MVETATKKGINPRASLLMVLHSKDSYKDSRCEAQSEASLSEVLLMSGRVLKGVVVIV